MPQCHGVDNCSLRFCRKGGQLDLGESRSPTQMFQQNLLPASHRLSAYVCSFGPGLMVMMAVVMMAMVMMTMVMMVMVMVSVMVIIVPEALRQVGSLRQRQHQSFHTLKVFHRPKASHGKLYSSRSVALSNTALSSRLSNGLSSRLSSRLSSKLSSTSGLSSGLAATVCTVPV